MSTTGTHMLATPLSIFVYLLLLYLLLVPSKILGYTPPNSKRLTADGTSSLNAILHYLHSVLRRSSVWIAFTLSRGRRAEPFRPRLFSCPYILQVSHNT